MKILDLIGTFCIVNLGEVARSYFDLSFNRNILYCKSKFLNK